MKRSRLSRWDPACPWAVPRDIKFRVPVGMAWADHGRCIRLTPNSAAQFIRPEDWGESTACQVCAVVLVSAVHANAWVIGSFPIDHRIYTKRPLLVRIRRGQQISITPAESRTGDLWAFPLLHLAGPTTEVTNSTTPYDSIY